MTQSQLIFEEKQYLGANLTSLVSRLGVATFCFIYYYYNLQKDQPGEIFLLIGFIVLLISMLLLFVRHLHTKIFEDHIELDGFWTTRKVKINFSQIISAEFTPLKKYFFSYPAYNLHRKGTIRFFTRGDSAISLKDKDGLIYLIGTQKPEELLKALTQRISKMI